MIFHIDANSFYASCERLFRPDLYNSPIAVLTNNDGIVIALNQECKDLGFKRGDVYHEVKNQLAAKGVKVFSSNYTLYADISTRLNLVYNRFSQEVEPYSIDESFLYFPDWTNADYSQIAFGIREAVSTETGIPVSIGIAPSKTLAKMCNKLSKKRNGICEWEKLDKAAELQNYPVGDIWGVGWSKTALLKSQGIMTAFDLQHYPLEKAKKYLTIVGMRTVQELNGITSIDHVHREGRQSIACSRSFSGAVFELHEITAALAEYTEEVVKRLRESKQACRRVTVYLMTKLAGDEQYSNAASAELPRASSFLPDILGTAIVLLKQIYRKGYRYRKVMIHLMGMEADNKNQLDLFEESVDRKERKQLMGAFDSINAKYGRGALHLGVHNPAKTDGFAPWEMKREFLSPEYTTRLADIPKVW